MPNKRRVRPGKEHKSDDSDLKSRKSTRKAGLDDNDEINSIELKSGSVKKNLRSASNEEASEPPSKRSRSVSVESSPAASNSSPDSALRLRSGRKAENQGNSNVTSISPAKRRSGRLSADHSNEEIPYPKDASCVTPKVKSTKSALKGSQKSKSAELLEKNAMSTRSSNMARKNDEKSPVLREQYNHKSGTPTINKKSETTLGIVKSASKMSVIKKDEDDLECESAKICTKSDDEIASRKRLPDEKAVPDVKRRRVVVNVEPSERRSSRLRSDRKETNAEILHPPLCHESCVPDVPAESANSKRALKLEDSEVRSPGSSAERGRKRVRRDVVLESLGESEEKESVVGRNTGEIKVNASKEEIHDLPSLRHNESLSPIGNGISGSHEKSTETSPVQNGICTFSEDLVDSPASSTEEDYEEEIDLFALSPYKESPMRDRKLIYHPHVESLNLDAQFSIMTYDLRADEPQNPPHPAYRHSAESGAAPLVSYDRVVREVEHFERPHILCLQNTSHKEFLQRLQVFLNSEGYEGSFLERDCGTGDALFYRTDVFHLVEKKTISVIELLDKALASNGLDSDTQRMVREYMDVGGDAVFVKLSLRSGKTICLCHMHLSALSLVKPDVCAVQVLACVNHVFQFADSSTPHIFIGELNASSGAIPYRLLGEGYPSDSVIRRLFKLKTVSIREGKQDALVNLFWRGFQHYSIFLRSVYHAVLSKEAAFSSPDRDNFHFIFYSSYLSPICVAELPSYLPSGDTCGSHRVFPTSMSSLYARLALCETSVK